MPDIYARERDKVPRCLSLKKNTPAYAREIGRASFAIPRCSQKVTSNNAHQIVSRSDSGLAIVIQITGGVASSLGATDQWAVLSLSQPRERETLSSRAHQKGLAMRRVDEEKPSASCAARCKLAKGVATLTAA